MSAVTQCPECGYLRDTHDPSCSWYINSRLDEKDAIIARQQQRIEELKVEAQGWAQEARTQKAIVQEIYQYCSGKTGESGDWHGAEPVKQRIQALEAEIERLKNSAYWQQKGREMVGDEQTP